MKKKLRFFKTANLENRPTRRQAGAFIQYTGEKKDLENSHQKEDNFDVFAKQKMLEAVQLLDLGPSLCLTFTGESLRKTALHTRFRAQQKPETGL